LFFISSVISDGSLTLHGGPVMDKDISLHFLYYGSWGKTDQEVLMTQFVGNNIVQTAWYQITRCLVDGDGNPVTNSISVADSFFLKPKWGTKFTSISDIFPVLTKAISASSLSLDPDDIYVLFLSDDMYAEPLCQDTCGYHYYFNESNGNQIKYIYIGSTGKINGCSGCVPPNGPFNNLTNQLVNSFAHQLIATVSNPIPWTGYFDQNNLQNSQKCAGNYPSSAPFQPDNSTSWNVVVGATFTATPHWFLIQGNWDNVANQCDVVGVVNCNLIPPSSLVTEQPQTSSSIGTSIQLNTLSLVILTLITIAFLF